MTEFDLTNYKIEVQKVPEDDGGGYMASMPDLGCIGDGETIDEAIEDLMDVTQELIEIAKKDGIKIPEPETYHEENYSGKLSLRIPKILHKFVAKQAQKEGCSINQLITSYISLGIGNEFGKSQVSINVDFSREFLEDAVIKQWKKNSDIVMENRLPVNFNNFSIF